MARYESADDFISKLLAMGVTLKKRKRSEVEGFDGVDFNTITTSCPFVLDAEKVQMFRDSEHYFCTSIRLKNGNLLHISAPINKIMLSTAKGESIK
jgi:hypothetical protein